MHVVLLVAAKVAAVAATAGHAAVAAGATVAHAATALGTTALHAVAGGGAAGSAATAAKTVSTGTRVLQALRVGTSVVSALSTYAQGQAQAQAAETQAFSEEMQARQEYLQSQEKAVSINRDFNRYAADTLAIAAASGIDVASGDVATVQQQARAEADRQISIARGDAEVNAQLRRANAAAYRASAKRSRALAPFAAAADLGMGVLDAKKAA